MEKAPNVAVVLSDFGWSDLGTWGSLHEKLPLDKHGNGTTGSELWAHDAAGNVVVTDATDAKKLVAIRGLNDFIVVDTKDALLVCPKSEEQWIKQLVTEMKTRKTR